MASFLVEAMVKGYHVYEDIWATVQCWWGISMPVWRWQQSRSFRCSSGQRGGHGWASSKEDICLRSLSMPGVREGVQRLPTTSSVLLSISNCSVVFVLESKFWHLQNFARQKKTRSLNFHILEFYAKMRNFAPYENFPLYGTLTLPLDSRLNPGMFMCNANGLVKDNSTLMNGQKRFRF